MSEKTKKRPRIGFFDIGLEKGDILYYKVDPSIVVRVEDTRRVKYNDRITFLSTITCELKHRDYNCQPSPFWIVKKTGKILKRVVQIQYKIIPILLSKIDK